MPVTINSTIDKYLFSIDGFIVSKENVGKGVIMLLENEERQQYVFLDQVLMDTVSPDTDFIWVYCNYPSFIFDKVLIASEIIATRGGKDDDN